METPPSCRMATSGSRGHRCRPALCRTARRIAGPRVDQDPLYILSPRVICDKRAKPVGILRQLCKKRPKNWENGLPSCGVAQGGRHGDRSLTERRGNSNGLCHRPRRAYRKFKRYFANDHCCFSRGLPSFPLRWNSGRTLPVSCGPQPPRPGTSTKPALWAVSSTGMFGQGGGIARLDPMPLLFHTPAYRITSSAWKRSVGGIVRPSAWAVLRLMTSSNFIGRSTGRSPGLAPFRMRST